MTRPTVLLAALGLLVVGLAAGASPAVAAPGAAAPAADGATSAPTDHGLSPALAADRQRPGIDAGLQHAHSRQAGALLDVHSQLAAGTFSGARSLHAAGTFQGASVLRSDSAVPTATATLLQAQDGDDEDVVHEHPDSAADASDVDLAVWLADYFQSSIEESAASLEDGEYEAARSAFDEDYEQRLDQYSQIAAHTERPTANGSDPRTRDEVALGEFEAIQGTQTALATSLLEYEESVASYQSARDGGDEERALELAREAVGLASDVQENASELRERYDRIESVLRRDYSSADAAVRAVAGQTRSEADGVATDAFSETTLIVETGDYRVAPDEAIVVEGTLLDEDGDPIEGATIAISDPVEPASGDVGGELAGSETIGSGATSTTQTDADGSFQLTHRSVFVPLATDSLVVEYRPERLAPHRASRTSIGVTVAQGDGELSTTDAPDSVQYGDDVGVEVTATTDDRDVAGVPVRLVVGGEAVAGVTNEDGSVDLPASVPRDLPPGDQSIRVEVPVESWSVAFESHLQTIAVETSEVSLTAESEAAGDSEIVVSGRLETAEGTPVADAPVTIEADDGQVRRATSDGPGATGPLTVRTDDDGRYEARLHSTSSADAVTVEHAESNTNLGDAEASTSLAEPSAAGGVLAQVAGLLTHPVVLIAVVLLVLAGAGLLNWQQWRPDGDGASEEATTGHDHAPDPADFDVVDEDEDPLAVAAGQVPDDPTTATMLAYGVGRSALDDELQVSPDATHREFLEACQANGFSEETIAAADTLTSQYEEAAFAPGQVDTETARTAINAARELR